MIAQLGKHLRKWLLGLAVAARNRAQAVVAKMEPVEAAADEEPGPAAAPEIAKTVRSGEPPAHWVQLVERHAPELLLPGPPYTAPRASTPVFESDAAGGQSTGDSAQDPASANASLDAVKSLAHEGAAFSLKLPRLTRRRGAPPSRRPTPDTKRSTRDTGRPAEAAAEPSRGDAGSRAPAATPAGSVKVQRAAASNAGAENSTRRRSLSPQPNAGPVDPQAPGPGTRKTEEPVARTSPAPRFGSAAGRIAKNRPVKREGQYMRPGTGDDFQPPSRTSRGVEPIHRPAEKRQAGLQSAAETPAPAAIKHEGADEEGPRPNESFKARPAFSDAKVQTAAPPARSRGDDRRHIEEVRLINRQRSGRPAEERANGGDKRLRPPEFHWPDLPGENSSEYDRESEMNPTWPSLPQASSAAAASWRPQSETDPWEAEPRDSERLRRLDEEQRGTSWSASHF